MTCRTARKFPPESESVKIIGLRQRFGVFTTDFVGVSQTNFGGFWMITLKVLS